MQIRKHLHPDSFWESCNAVLMQSEDKNNLMIGILENLRANWDEMKGEALLYTFSNDEIHQHGPDHFHSHVFPPSLMAIRTDASNGWILAGDEGLPMDFLFPATLCLKGMHPEVSTVTGERTLSEQFAKIWDPEAKLDFGQLLYRCDKAIPPAEIVPGKVRVATSDDSLLLTGWMEAFFKESLRQSINRGEALAKVEHALGAGSVWIWDDDGPKSMVFITRNTTNGCCLSYVFTPPQARRRGYAKNLVAIVTEAVLSQKQFAVLYADADFEGSNILYRSIGYQVIAEGAKYFLQ